jgi:N-formylmaleamate deformylase
MLSLISDEIVANGTRLHYYRTGGEKPPIVLVHGLTDDGLCWMPAAEVLSQSYDVVMVDMRGHGKSEAPEDGYTLTTIATELAYFIQELGLQKPVILGHSMGAITALVLAALFPDLPRHILLEEPPPFWNFQNISPDDVEHRNSFIAWAKGLKRRTRDELIAECHEVNSHWSEAEIGPWADAKHRCSIRVTALALPEDVPSLNFPILLQSITCPVLFISAATERGALSGKEDIAKLNEWLPRLQVSHIATAGHSIRRDAFSHYMEVVQKALTSSERV